ncbi:MAG: permease prefix domain 1-containing protein, partial [Gemmatimonadaceae bacterium]
MSEPNRLLRYFRFLRPDVRADADDEIGFHLEMRVRDLVARGLSPDAAREQAKRDFGDLPLIRNQVVAIDERRRRRTTRREWVDDVMQDLRFSARSLRRCPGFSAMAITCVALGVAVTTTIFAAVNAILIRPLPFAHPEELISIYSRLKKTNEGGINISWPDYVSWRNDNRTMAGMGIWTWNSLALSGDGEAERVEAASVSANVFPILGVRPMLGRNFSENEEQRGEDHVVILG